MTLLEAFVNDPLVDWMADVKADDEPLRLCEECWIEKSKFC